MKLNPVLILFVVCIVRTTFADPFIGIYAAGSVYANNDNLWDHIKSLRSSGFTALLPWCIHVNGDNGDLVYDAPSLISNGQYVGDPLWPSELAAIKLLNSTVEQMFISVGSGGVSDFTSIQSLIQAHGTGPDSILYQNFAAIKKTFPMIDGVDLDDEDLYDTDTIVQFTAMLGKIGFKVSWCIYAGSDFWINCLQQVESTSPGTVVQFNLQCYAGGTGNNPVDWQNAIYGAGLSTPVYPGLWNLQSNEDQVQDLFSQWKAQGIQGGFMWYLDDIVNSGQTVASWADAVRKGLAV